MDWYRAEIVFQADEAMVDRLRSAISGQDVVEIGHLEVSKVNELTLLDEPQATGLHQHVRGLE